MRCRRRIAGRSQCHDGISKHAADHAAQPARGFPPPALFDALQELEDFRRGDLRDRPVRQRCCQVLQQPTVLAHRRGRSIALLLVGKIFRGDGPKRVVRGHHGRGLRLLSLFARVDQIEQQLLGLLAPVTRLSELHHWIGSEGQQFLLARKTVLHLPGFGAVGAHQDVQSAAIRKLVGTLPGRSLPNGQIRQVHWGYRLL